MRSDPQSVHSLKDAIAGNVEAAGLQSDCPLREGQDMSAEETAAASDEVGEQQHCGTGRRWTLICVLTWFSLSFGGVSLCCRFPHLLTAAAAAAAVQEFLGWCERLFMYLQTLENRLFSEGLHVLGAAPSDSQMAQYLGAYYGDALPTEAVEVLAAGQGVEAARAALEQAWQQVRCCMGS